MKTLTSTRRNFLKSLGIVGSSILVSIKTVIANQDKMEEGDGNIIRLKNENISYLQPTRRTNRNHYQTWNNYRP